MTIVSSVPVLRCKRGSFPPFLQFSVKSFKKSFDCLHGVLRLWLLV